VKPQTGHTPGPWNTDGRFILSGTNPGAPYIADCLPGHEYRTEGSTQANAALIAAAPETKAQRDELLAALKKAVERMEAISEHLPVEKRAVGVSQRGHVQHLAGHLFQHAKIARAAIARAEKGGGK